MRLRPQLPNAADRKRYLTWVWVLTTLSTGYGFLVAAASVGWLAIAPLMAIVVYGAMVAIALSVWGVGFMGTDSNGRRALIVGGACLPWCRIKPTLSWSLLYVPMLLGWCVIVTPGSAWLYIAPALFVGLVFGGIVAAFIDDQVGLQDPEQSR